MMTNTDYFKRALEVVSEIDKECEFGIFLNKDKDDEYNEVYEVCAVYLEFVDTNDIEVFRDGIRSIGDNYGSKYIIPSMKYFTKTLSICDYFSDYFKVITVGRKTVEEESSEQLDKRLKKLQIQLLEEKIIATRVSTMVEMVKCECNEGDSKYGSGVYSHLFEDMMKIVKDNINKYK